MGCTLNPYFCNGSQWCQRECNFGGDAEGIKEQLQGIRERESHFHWTTTLALYRASYTDIAKFAGHLPHRYGNSRAIWDYTVLPATGQR